MYYVALLDHFVFLHRLYVIVILIYVFVLWLSDILNGIVQIWSGVVWVTDLESVYTYLCILTHKFDFSLISQQHFITQTADLRAA